MTTLVAPPGVIEIGSAWPGAGGSTPPVDPPVVDPLDVSLTDPADTQTVITYRPSFTVAVDTSDEDDDATFTMTIQYADNADFTNPQVLTGDFDTVDAGIVLTATSNIAQTTYWRARVSQGSTLRSAWTPAARFNVNSSVVPTELSVTWNVDASTAVRPIHLWHFDPPGPDAGDVVTVYGQGFPSTGALRFGDGYLSVTSWRLIPAANLGTTSVIDGDNVDPEHYEVTFVAPAYSGPGEALTVEAS